MDKRPNSKVNLDRAIQRIYGTGAKYVEIRSMIANTIVGQFLPEGVVKGGSALRLRYGLGNTRPLPQREVADKLGISRSYVSRIEKKALQKLKNNFVRGV